MDISRRIKELEARLERGKDRRIYPALARLLLHSGDCPGARAIIDRGEDEYPDYIPILMVSAEIRDRSGDAAGAWERYQRIVGLDPDNLVALERLVRGCREGGDLERARELLRHILALDPENDAAMAALSEMGDEPALDSGVTGDKGFKGLRPTETMAELYAGQGAVDEAVAIYRMLLERDPSNTRWRDRLRELETGEQA